MVYNSPDNQLAPQSLVFEIAGEETNAFRNRIMVNSDVPNLNRTLELLRREAHYGHPGDNEIEFYPSGVTIMRPNDILNPAIPAAITNFGKVSRLALFTLISREQNVPAPEIKPEANIRQLQQKLEDTEHRLWTIETAETNVLVAVWKAIQGGHLTERGPIADTTLQLRDALNPTWPLNDNWLPDELTKND